MRTGKSRNLAKRRRTENESFVTSGESGAETPKDVNFETSYCQTNSLSGNDYLGSGEPVMKESWVKPKTGDKKQKSEIGKRRRDGKSNKKHDPHEALLLVSKESNLLITQTQASSCTNQEQLVEKEQRKTSPHPGKMEMMPALKIAGAVEALIRPVNGADHCFLLEAADHSQVENSNEKVMGIIGNKEKTASLDDFNDASVLVQTDSTDTYGPNVTRQETWEHCGENVAQDKDHENNEDDKNNDDDTANYGCKWDEHAIGSIFRPRSNSH